MNKKTLHLNLHKKWFDMILSGKKDEEYRELTDYWYSRLLTKDRKQRKFETITFSNGMKKIEDLRRFEIECCGIDIDYPEKSLGGDENRMCFILYLGKIISRSNC